MEYYIASDQGPLGPYNLQQLKERPIHADDMVWCNGMPEWSRADQIEELSEIINAPATPPSFDRQRFESAYNTPSEPESRFTMQDNEECPPTYRWLAIIAFLGIIPCAIVALIKSVMVTRLWEEGNREGARHQSRKALTWGLISVIIGIPLSIYMLFFSDQAELTNNLLEQILK